MSPTSSSPTGGPPRRTVLLVLGGVLLLAVAASVLWGPDPRAVAVELLASDFGSSTAEAGQGLDARFDGADASREQLPLRLEPVLTGAERPTDLQFPPGRSDLMVVLEKQGGVRVARRTGETWTWGEELLRLEVLTSSEQGVLGLAFAPDFASSGHLYINHSVRSGGDKASRVSRFTVADPAAATWTAGEELVILEVVQPYANHNAGQLAFGPDGMLYIGWGDGGYADDPHNNGQDAGTWLGSMLRIDVSEASAAAPYAVPPDNPFLDRPGARPETWAIGLRNPWRYSFAPDGRLVVADVGQNAWEEVTIVAAGSNHGWKAREARHCFPASVRSCPDPAEVGLTEPVYEYPHDEGTSITGGYVYTGSALPALAGRYVFADFTTGRIWSIALPPASVARPPLAEAMAHGRFGLLISTFGQDAEGELYLADFGNGGVYRLASR